MEKIKTDRVIIVEGKYDKIKLSEIVDAHILTTDGFSLFNNAEKRALIRRLAKKCGIVILTDSDGAGFVIRNKLRGYIGNDSEIINLYAPQIVGKEARKSKGSKEGLLGVEGIEARTIRGLFEKAGITSEGTKKEAVYTKADLYSLGLSGGSDSSARRDEICEKNDLPKGMSANAFLAAVNLLGIEL
ncbi:MAG: DUF4093 domain-containing protein [Clostridia bacterium]|nr:DUF4093 domain-containing protein [Clostridia bacterium]